MKNHYFPHGVQRPADPKESIEISIIVPCYNEEGNILRLCKRVAETASSLGVAFEMIYIDDGSTDATADAIRKAQEAYPFVVGVYKRANEGIAAAWHAGYAVSRGRYVVTIDADLQYRPEDIAELYKKIKEGQADLVQGRRLNLIDQGLLRWILSVGLSFLLNVTFHTRLKDNKSGFIMYRREVLGDILAERWKFKHYQHFITIAACSKGYTIIQHPVPFGRRIWGTSFIQHPLRFSTGVLLEFGKAFYEFRLKSKKSKLPRFFSTLPGRTDVRNRRNMGRR
jgi:phenylacetate-CoA ligase